MSEDKKTGYRLEYASTARAKCKGPKPCSGAPILKGALRMGTLVEIAGHSSFQWRHWGCVTAKLIGNMKKNFSDADDLDGFEDLKPEDQERVKKAYEAGEVDPADATVAPEGEEEGGSQGETQEEERR
ncbi:hypothetical protein BDV98DRAFT_613935 [Pterulicium gracile]|uniref:PARP-type domain-containing protein n=1 Tax=Pterulicium gracile TaxID=1884261 RepID=A0A5C3Q852_9AGAR|nr:hypothetical protein BDV98DRAFT_613935 [Pterula gracilis]